MSNGKKGKIQRPAHPLDGLKGKARERAAAEMARRIGREQDRIDASYGYSGESAGKAPHRGASVADAATHKDRRFLRNITDAVKTFKSGR